MHIIKFLFLISCLLSTSLYSALEVKKANVGDVDLAYYTRGKGEPLILIIGYRKTMADWDPALLDDLSSKYQLILFDNRGVGLSTDSQENNTTIWQMADDTAALIKSLGFEKVHVLGWSMGSRIAQQVAIRHPKLVKSLILAATNPGGKHRISPEDWVTEIMRSPKETQAQRPSLMFTNEAAAHAYKERLERAIADGKAPKEPEVSEETQKRQLRALGVWIKANDTYKDLGKIDLPTLVAGGLEDVIDPVENSQIVAARIPFSWAAFFPGTGHAFLFQEHGRFAKLVSLFTDSLSSGQN